jgi:serine/threonine protein phosphatase PrpC
MEKELVSKRPPLLSTDIVSPQIWQECLKSKDKDCDEYCTTCSFAFIDKSAKQITVGQIGDSPIFIKVDCNKVIELRQEKDFSNITDSLGGNTVSTFRVQNYHYKDSIKVMVTSDGIGEELESSSLDSLFSYLSSTYQQYTPKSRSRRFTKEIKETIGKVNHDDKSAIYIWSI